MDTYGGSGHSSVKMAVRATMTQLMTALAEKTQVHSGQVNKVVVSCNYVLFLIWHLNVL